MTQVFLCSGQYKCVLAEPFGDSFGQFNLGADLLRFPCSQLGGTESTVAGIIQLPFRHLQSIFHP